MQINVTQRDGAINARLQDALDIASVTEARDHLLQILEAGDRVRIDFSSLTEIDTAGVQLVLAVRKESVACRKECRFVHPSAQVEEAFRVLGCASIFDESVVTVQAKG
jgi:anti-anti-sigma factor